MASFVGPRAKKLVVLSGPNKTFNIAGLHICQVIARDEATRFAMKRAISAWGFGQPNAFSLAAALAAYREGGPWLDELLAYLKGNYRFLLDFLAERLPDIGVSSVEGSYLAWLDLRALLEGRGEGFGEEALWRGGSRRRAGFGFRRDRASARKAPGSCASTSPVPAPSSRRDSSAWLGASDRPALRFTFLPL
jgi:hypothetical protein